MISKTSLKIIQILDAILLLIIISISITILLEIPKVCGNNIISVMKESNSIKYLGLYGQIVDFVCLSEAGIIVLYVVAFLLIVLSLLVLISKFIKKEQ